MSYPRYNELTAADKANDWKPGITQKEYSEAKAARTEMLNQIAGRNVAPLAQRKASRHDRRVQQSFNVIMKKAREEAKAA